MRFFSIFFLVILISCENKSQLKNEKNIATASSQGINITKSEHINIPQINSDSYVSFQKKYSKFSNKNAIISNIYGANAVDSVIFFPIDTISFKQHKSTYLPTIGDTAFSLDAEAKIVRIIITHIMECDSLNLAFSTENNQPLNCDFGQFGLRGSIMDSSNSTKRLWLDFIFKMQNSFSLLDSNDFYKANGLYFSNNKIQFDFQKKEFTNTINKISGRIELINYFNIDDRYFLLIERVEEEYSYREIYEQKDKKLNFQFSYPMD